MHMEKPIRSDFTNVIVQHIGYFHPDKSGDYGIVVPKGKGNKNGADDAVYVWIGSNAKSGWNNQNPTLLGDYYDQPPAKESFTYSVSKDQVGEYVPIRILWVNAQLCGSFAFKLIDPSGKVVAASDTSATDDVLVTSCGSAAPAFDFAPR